MCIRMHTQVPHGEIGGRTARHQRVRAGAFRFNAKSRPWTMREAGGRRPPSRGLDRSAHSPSKRRSFLATALQLAGSTFAASTSAFMKNSPALYDERTSGPDATYANPSCSACSRYHSNVAGG
eukprot:CAMPEP_0195572372 /NCGR_PEP_ID=MMETSP0814-20130614/4692_1 /TAXON_ID=97485 /ORGANISM="Prymnesium parvum, Strain Texoma1" /LENGTH=122 /DNA_ID=CAMNT_0040708125 /DNA_START=282 /DNA_END=646 /DNA_ORIENTATION=-